MKERSSLDGMGSRTSSAHQGSEAALQVLSRIVNRARALREQLHHGNTFRDHMVRITRTRTKVISREKMKQIFGSMHTHPPTHSTHTHTPERKKHKAYVSLFSPLSPSHGMQIQYQAIKPREEEEEEKKRLPETFGG